MPVPLPPAESVLDRYIEASGESNNIDAKGPISWDGGDESAALAKDIAAFANSRDGGVLVIGKSEDGSGTFSLTGLSEEQAETFETTKVAQWINSRFSPPIDVVCHHREYQGKRFVVITVAEFHDIPIICTKQLQQPGNPKNLLLRKGAIYIRNSNAESAPIGTVEELRTLIGIATSKRGNEMLAMFDSMLKGRPLLAAPSDDERFDEELSRIEEELDPAIIKKAQLGAWRLVVRRSSMTPSVGVVLNSLKELSVAIRYDLETNSPASAVKSSRGSGAYAAGGVMKHGRWLNPHSFWRYAHSGRTTGCMNVRG